MDLTKMGMIQLQNPSHPSGLLCKANQMRLAGTLCDVVIMVDSQEFHAHRTVLACTSKMFEILFHRNSQHYTLDFLSPKTFQQILEYAYTATLQAKAEDLDDLQIDNTMNVNGLWEEEPKKKRKKKKKDPVPGEAEGGSTELADFPGVALREETDLQVDNVNGGPWQEEPEEKQLQENHQSQDPVFLASDSSGYQSDHKKKKRKRKHSEEAELTPLLEHTPKKKRKR